MTILREGESLHSQGNDKIVTRDNNFTLKMQPDGNLVVYFGHNHSPANAMWASDTDRKGQGPYRLTMQADGNLVIYDSRNHATWSTCTDQKGAKGGYVCKLKSNGQIVVMDKYKQILFSSRPTTKYALMPATCCHKPSGPSHPTHSGVPAGYPPQPYGAQPGGYPPQPYGAQPPYGAQQHQPGYPPSGYPPAGYPPQHYGANPPYGY